MARFNEGDANPAVRTGSRLGFACVRKGKRARWWALGRPKAASMPSCACVSTRACQWLGHGGGPVSARRDAPYDDRYKQGGRGHGATRGGGVTRR
jgi:hypothetical protein